MNLEELRKSMESEATIENKKLKDEIKELKAQFQSEQKERSHEKAQLISDCRVLSNRCWALTHGAMCCICGLNGYICDHAWPLYRKIAEAKKMMNKEKKDEHDELGKRRSQIGL